MVRRCQRPRASRRPRRLLAKTQTHLPNKNNRPCRRNPSWRQQDFHLSRRRPPLLPPPPRRRHLHRLQPPLHPPHLPRVLSARRPHLHLPLPRRNLLRHQRRSPGRPPAQAPPTSNPRPPRQRHRRHRLRPNPNLIGAHQSNEREKLLATLTIYRCGGVLYFTAFASTPSVTVTITSAGISFNSCTYPLGQRIKIESTFSCFPNPK
jgi:hypothetical protein